MKIKKFKNTNTVLFLIAALNLIMFFSCMDAIDADNPTKVPVNPKNEPKPPENTKIKKSDINWMFSETFIISGGSSLRQTWWGYTKYIRNEIIIDTAKSLPSIWIDLEAESQIPEQQYSNTGERVQSFRLKADSLVLNELLFVNETQRDGTFAELRVKKITQNRVEIYTGRDITIGISLLSNGISGTFQCLINATLYNQRTTSLVQFEGYAEIKYLPN